VYFDNSMKMKRLDPELKNITSREKFLELGHRILNLTVEQSNGYLKIRNDKGKKNVFNCPDDYPVRPLAVFYGVSESDKKWYAGESRNFYPEPFLTQVSIKDEMELIDMFFHAIVFY
jgi:hypothetical protein